MGRRSPESMVKRAREQALREKRELKQAKKDARKLAAGEPALPFEETVVRIARLASGQGGTISAADVEADDVLGRDRDTTVAAAHMLAEGTNVVSQPADEDTEWFPYAELTFTSVVPIPDDD